MIRFEELERIHVELSSACNAACPVCPRNVDGGYTVPWLNIRTMSFKDFKLIFDKEVLTQIKDILMCGNYGDPVYCKDLPDILAYINEINSDINVRVHTNGSIRESLWWKCLPLQHKNLIIVFSIDGLEDTNHIYRRNVNWHDVINNAKAYIGAGGNAIWEYLIFQHNEHQLDDARSMSQHLGFQDILFKRAFGFDSINGDYDAMRVIDRKGKVEYYIYPPTNNNYQNRDKDGKKLKRYEKNNGLPIETFQTDWQHKNNDYEKIIQKEIDNYKHLDGINISCMTKNNKEIYIDSAGHLHPCCFLGIGAQNVTLAHDSLQYHKWLEKNIQVNETNLKIHNLREVMNSDFLHKIEDTWNLSHCEGRMMCCSKMCSVEYSPRKRLYIK